MQLPESFLTQMKAFLGDEFDAFLNSYDEKGAQGLRVNTAKISAADFQRLSPFALERVPWTENGFYTKEADPVAKSPYYYAGLYYVQEPSAMLPAALLDVKPHDKVLDLCAAPGGKATELGSRLRGTGLLVANDISPSRAKALLKNIELAGIGNVLVCSETPQKLAASYVEYFDKILVDAPCSGEGMFRREPSMIKSYMEHGPAYYAALQKEIVASAVKMLKPGGKMVYSTCTFSPQEDEEIVCGICEADASMRVAECRRLFPHRVRGEGHFAALLEKCAEHTWDGADAYEGTDAPGGEKTFRAGKTEAPKEWLAFCEEALRTEFEGWQLMNLQNRLYALPPGIAVRERIRYLRTGLLLGEIRQKRFEPSQALAMYLKREQAAQTLSLAGEDPRVLRYLKGETLELTQEEAGAGWTLVCVDGYPLGWGKRTQQTMKNKYYPGWRMV